MRRATPRTGRVGRAFGIGPNRAARPERRVRASGLVAVTALAVLLMGCSPAPTPAPATSSRPASPTTTGVPTATPTPSAPPALLPQGTAADNLPFFTSVVTTVWATPDDLRGLAYIDALTAAGFDRSAMQVTSDTTTIGEPAESIQFSVAWRDACLVGQVGPATGDPATAVLPLLAGGRCLIGETASLDG